ncbi:response regulator transcription factor [Clostridium sp. LBM24168]
MYNILIVDDREIFRRLFKRFKIFKENEDFSINFEAQNGVDAIKILENFKIDVVITDIRMPIMDGIELLRRIKKRKLSNCVILLSEYADFSYAKEGIVLGAFDYIVKPIEEDKLVELLKRIKDHLDVLKKNKNYNLPNIKILPKLILNNDNYIYNVANSIIESIMEEKKYDICQINERLYFLINFIKEEILKRRSYISKYSDLDEIFNIREIYIKSDIKKIFCERIKIITKEVNKFNIRCKSELVKNICKDIINNLENGVTLQQVADMHFVNKTYLSHLFKQEVGVSYVNFVTFVKMERAKILLKKTNKKIYEIAVILGYDDSEYFSKIFKNTVGVAPTEYRQNYLLSNFVDVIN